MRGPAQCDHSRRDGKKKSKHLEENAMGETILIIEDNRLNLRLFNDLVMAKGHRPIGAVSASEGLALARLHLPKLIVVDVQLPDISGLEVVQIVRSEWSLRDIPVLAASAFQSSASAEWLLQHQCDGFIAKPVSARPFMELVEKLLSEAAMAAEMLPRTLAAHPRGKSAPSATSAG